MFYTVLLISEVLLSVSLITLILMQHGKGADAGAAFGSGASGTVFGARGSGNFLSRTTAVLAALFFLNCLVLAYIVSSQQKSVGAVESVVDRAGPVVSAPVTPGEGADVPGAAQPVDIPDASEGAALGNGGQPGDIPE